jgi:hypothetical protein
MGLEADTVPGRNGQIGVSEPLGKCLLVRVDLLIKPAVALVEVLQRFNVTLVGKPGILAGLRERKERTEDRTRVRVG